MFSDGPERQQELIELRILAALQKLRNLLLRVLQHDAFDLLLGLLRKVGEQNPHDDLAGPEILRCRKHHQHVFAAGETAGGQRRSVVVGRPRQEVGSGGQRKRVEDRRSHSVDFLIERRIIEIVLHAFPARQRRPAQRLIRRDDGVDRCGRSRLRGERIALLMLMLIRI